MKKSRDPRSNNGVFADERNEESIVVNCGK
jgi:hypothetical protein